MLSAVDATGSDISVFANYGVLGLMFVFVVGALLTGNLVAGWVYKSQVAKLEKQIEDQAVRYEKELERERAEKLALRTRMDDQVIPLLSDTGHLLRDALRTIGPSRDKGAGT